MVLETRQLVGPWTEQLDKDVTEKLALRAARDAMDAALDARIEAVGLDHSTIRVTVRDGELDIELRADGPDVEKILAALEGSS